MRLSILTGGKDPHYALGLLGALLSKPIQIDFIGNNEMGKSEIMKSKNVKYLNLRGDQNPNANIIRKGFRVIKYYIKLINYALHSKTKLFHILWLNKFFYFDSIILTQFYKCLSKKLIYTAHNINIRERDGGNSWLYQKSLSFMYHKMDHIFVHTNKMKDELIKKFGIEDKKISVIPFGINEIIPQTNINRNEARKRLGLNNREKIILFFGNIAPYKGLEYLLEGFNLLYRKGRNYKLFIVGRVKNCTNYFNKLLKFIKDNDLKDKVELKIEYIPDEEVEIYFKSADVLVLPYRIIFQSGVLFLSYNFGLPVIATDVGALREEIIERETGFICRPGDPKDIADKIDFYFESDLYRNLEENRIKIIEYAKEKYSWSKVAEKTYQIYKKLME